MIMLSAWFEEQEGYGVRRERFMDDLDKIAAEGELVASDRAIRSMHAWISAAYELGVKDGLKR